MPPRRRGKSSSRHRASSSAAAAPQPAAPQVPANPPSIRQAVAAREFFWNNVVREILVSLASAALSADGRSENQNRSPDSRTDLTPAQLFDGRIAVITKGGNRLGIAGIVPVFGAGSSKDRTLSMLVECTVFQIRTPEGEVWTLPLHEIAAVHSISDELLAELRKNAPGEESPEENAQPFGFAAFTSMARLGKTPDRPQHDLDFLGE